MGAKVTFKIDSVGTGGFTPCTGVKWTPETASQFHPSYSSGQIIFVEDTQRIYVDFHNYRVEYGSQNGGGGNAKTFKFQGTAKTSPAEITSTTGEIELIDGTKFIPNEFDVLAYKKKEYAWRMDTESNPPKMRWLELGDEHAPEWDDEDE